MILVDTSVWVDHFRQTEPQLQFLLESRQVICHPFIIGELALGNMRDRSITLRHLTRLPAAVVAKHHEVMSLIEASGLGGRGIGYVDAHLLAAARLSGARLWARDKRLAGVASELEAHYERDTAAP